MKQTANLKKKTPLKRTNSLKPTAKKRKKQTIPALTKKADKAFSRYIRLRDCSYVEGGWWGGCITCNRSMCILDEFGKWQTGANLGHFIGRGCKETRYDEFNCNLQCPRCNAWRDKEDMLQAYRKGIVDKYGDSILRELKQRAKILRTNTRAELEEVIHDSTVEVEQMLAHPERYSTNSMV